MEMVDPHLGKDLLNKPVSAGALPMPSDTHTSPDLQDSAPSGALTTALGGDRLPVLPKKVAPRAASLRMSPNLPEDSASAAIFPTRSPVSEKIGKTIAECLSALGLWVRSMTAAPRAWGWHDKVLGPRVSAAQREGITREEELRLVERVFPKGIENTPRAALFLGLEEDAGSGTICARSGQILASRREGPVCIVDANFLSPSLHAYFCVENVRGLAEATRDPGHILDFARRLEDDLWILPAGESATQTSLHAADGRIGERLAELRTAFRYVVIHGVPLHREAGSILISRWTDGVVLFLEANSSRRVSAASAKHRLAAMNVRLLGVALNNRRFSCPPAIYGRW